ncbi:uncharacterized protein LOC130676962 [Microplitis mediator]|uniref:uncharacterized protein LOC130676962 n=1 Tax=Microplitis mediator TaxID=375433 RepID=UPI002557A1C0|nr:uncharacterized protein LOC130676962 [Microplitis mediator]
MSIDIFGRSLPTGAAISGPPGPPGRGFQITVDGQYDVESKRLCHVGKPAEDNDAATVKFTRDLVHKELSLMYDSMRNDQSEIISHLHSQVVTLDSIVTLSRKENQELKVIIKPYELHRPARRNYQRRHVDIRALDETWQADLVETIPCATVNKENKYLLTVIDIFSKYAWAVPIKSKSGSDVTSAMKSIFQQGRVPKNLHVDQGKEFYNKEFQELMKRKNINMYSIFSNLKASICERFNRTLKNNMWRQFTKHRTIQLEPIDVTAKNEKQIFEKIYKPLQDQRQARKNKFKVGDKVRISKYKHVFEKGYTPNWTTEIFTIKTVQNTNPTTYKLVDNQDKPIEGFYVEELSKVKHPDVYLIEKIIKKRGNKLYVKWLGFDSSHNTWIDKSDL